MNESKDEIETISEDGTQRRDNNQDRRANASDRRESLRVTVSGERRQNSDDRRD